MLRKLLMYLPSLVIGFMALVVMYAQRIGAWDQMYPGSNLGLPIIILASGSLLGDLTCQFGALRDMRHQWLPIAHVACHALVHLALLLVVVVAVATSFYQGAVIVTSAFVMMLGGFAYWIAGDNPVEKNLGES